LNNREIRCTGFILNENNELLLLEHENIYGIRYWWLPGGGLEENESFESGLKREIKEELNLDVEIIDSFMLDGEKLQRSYKKYFVGIIRINKNIKIELEKTGKGKILKYEWFKINKMDNNSKIIMDSDIYPFVEKGINYLNNEIMIENLRDK